MDYEVMDPEVAKQLMEKQAKSKDAAVHKAEGDGTPYPALDGKRVMNPTGTVYFIWNGGLRSWVPDPDTYNSIFANWDGILKMTDGDISLIQQGDTLTSGSAIVRADGSDPQYLLTLNQKYGIVNPNVKAYCDFADPQVVSPPDVLWAVPDGPFNIDYGA